MSSPLGVLAVPPFKPVGGGSSGQSHYPLSLHSVSVTLTLTITGVKQAAPPHHGGTRAKQSSNGTRHPVLQDLRRRPHRLRHQRRGPAPCPGAGLVHPPRVRMGEPVVAQRDRRRSAAPARCWRSLYNTGERGPSFRLH